MANIISFLYIFWKIIFLWSNIKPLIIDARMCKIAPSGPLINSVNHRYGNVKWLPYLQEIIISISPSPFLFSDVLPTHHRLFYQRTKSDNNHIMDSLLRHVLSCFWLTRVLALQRLGWHAEAQRHAFHLYYVLIIPFCSL